MPRGSGCLCFSEGCFFVSSSLESWRERSRCTCAFSGLEIGPSVMQAGCSAARVQQRLQAFLSEDSCEGTSSGQLCVLSAVGRTVTVY